MAIDSFKVNKSLSLNPQSTTIANPINGDLYYQEGKGFSSYKDGFWHDLTDVIDFAASSSMTSFNLDDATVRNNVIKLTGTLGAAANLHGLSASAKGKIVYIYNQTNQNILLKHQSFTETTPENRIVSSTGKDIKLKPNQSAQCFYDTTSSRWLAVGGVGGAEDPVVVPLLNNVTNEPIPEIVFDSNETHVVDVTGSIERVYQSAPVLNAVDTTFMNNAVNPTDFDGEIFVTAVHPDGRIFVGGNFTAYKGQAGKNGLIALNPNGTEDTTFSTNAVVSGSTPNFYATSVPAKIYAIAFQSDGKVLVGGDFIAYKGQAGANSLIRLTSNGSEDTAFTSSAVKNGSTARMNGAVRTILVQDDGAIVVGGEFSSYDGDASRGYLIRLLGGGALDTSFNDGPGGITWNLNFNPLNGNWTSVTYGNGTFVAVRNDGTISGQVATSPDGVTWTFRSIPVANAWDAIAYGNSRFVAIARGGGTANQVMTSPDGITWTMRNSAADRNWTSVAYGNNTFVAVSEDNTSSSVMTSPDGITWTSRTAAANNLWTSVIYGNNTFVAVSSDGIIANQVMTSPDGITWTSRTAAAYLVWTSVTYGNGTFVAVSNSTVTNPVMTSPDGITWTSRTVAANDSWEEITYGNGVFAAIGVGTNRVMTSPDGITWTYRSVSSRSWNKITYGNNTFVAMNNGPDTLRVMTSNFTSTLDSYPLTIEQIDANNLLVGGVFGYNDGTNISAYLIKLTKSAGSYVTYASPNYHVYKIKKQSNGDVLIGGAFTGLAGANYITRLSPSVIPDSTFIANTSGKITGAVRAIDVTSTGNVLLGGDFTNYNGDSGKSYLVRLDSTGNEITTFNSDAVTGYINDSVNTISVLSDDTVLFGGKFTSYKSVSHRFIKLINSAPGVDVEYLTKLNFSAIYRNSTSAWEISGVTWTGDNPETTISIDGATGTLQYSTSNLPGTEIVSVMKVKSTIL